MNFVTYFISDIVNSVEYILLNLNCLLYFLTSLEISRKIQGRLRTRVGSLNGASLFISLILGPRIGRMAAVSFWLVDFRGTEVTFVLRNSEMQAGCGKFLC